MFEALLEQIATGLDSRGIPYMVVGGQAVLLYGEPRLTRDVDVTLGVGPDRLPLVLEWVQSCGWQVLVERPAEFVAQTLVLPCQEPVSGIRVDVMFSFSPYERQAIERARSMPVGQAQVRYAAVEDVVVQKIIAGRPRDLEDVRSIILKNAGLEADYVRNWLREFEVQGNEGFLTRFETMWNRRVN